MTTQELKIWAEKHNWLLVADERPHECVKYAVQLDFVTPSGVQVFAVRYDPGNLFFKPGEWRFFNA